jgi:hypothetical protein
MFVRHGRDVAPAGVVCGVAVGAVIVFFFSHLVHQSVHTEFDSICNKNDLLVYSFRILSNV